MSESGPALTPTAAQLMDSVHGANIYAGFSPIRALDLQGWNGTHPALARAVAEVKPAVAFDIGVWKGQSVARLAEAMRQERPDSALLAIDTFLGSPGHWDRTRPDRIVESLGLVHGWPSLYWQFLSNMVLSGHAERVVPLPQTSDNAVVILKHLRIRADLIHIDAAHEYDPVRRDIENYWPLLRGGGIMIGDDYPWPGVKQAADEFAAVKGLQLEVDGPKWTLRKPA
ncbi:class I SAM-dependent methyltransferase [Roseomonas sp. SSH11]|uniref:Class I SAM-dependent methyltransferase n=1 Tax=Pararoseomonas baculiformis TaxID=2820812 RepID=A0ABS4AHT8_9PROT|nr:class I SAM-dependent methyltransferase [Pararoseomonas baculiformis]MBP0446095.1 class I SAM-dependent methyltransferase [Pararoseomonas baculiformis]